MFKIVNIWYLKNKNNAQQEIGDLNANFQMCKTATRHVYFGNDENENNNKKMTHFDHLVTSQNFMDTNFSPFNIHFSTSIFELEPMSILMIKTNIGKNNI